MNQKFNFINRIVEKDLKLNIYKKIHTRFPPEPNGYLHIGHAKSICLNFGIAKKYHGTCNLRFDDTNPDKEHEKYIKSIKEDICWLGFKWDGDVHYVSDYFEKLYNYAIELIQKGLAYVDELSADEIKEYRGTLKKSGKNSPYRSRSIEENLTYFYNMRDGMFPAGSICLRAKINMSSNVIIMRDPVLYRIKYTPHYRLKKTWCIYPTYDFSHCIADAIEGITHSLCTLEFQDNRLLYNWILHNISINAPYPTQYEFSRLNLKYTITSKRILSVLVDKKIVEGWNDPRMPTISGLRKRGYTTQSIHQFCQKIGMSKQESIIELSFLESCIRSDLNVRSPRLMAVICPIKIKIDNLPDGYYETILIPNHPNNPSMGKRFVFFSQTIFIDRSDFCIVLQDPKCYKLTIGKEIRLRYAYIIKAQYVELDKSGNIMCVHCVYDPDTLNKHPKDGRTIYGVIHWVSEYKNISAEFHLYEKLCFHPHPVSIHDVLDNVNPKSLQIFKGFVEKGLFAFNQFEPYQFEREGYFIIDHNNEYKSYVVLNRIVTLKNVKKTL